MLLPSAHNQQSRQMKRSIPFLMFRYAAILAASGLEWTIVAAPFLTDDPATGDVGTVVDGKGPGRSLTRADFAAVLLDALDRPEWVGHMVGVANL